MKVRLLHTCWQGTVATLVERFAIRGTGRRIKTSKQANKLAFICQSRTRGPGRPGKLKEEGNEVLKPETIARHPGEMPLDISLGF